MIWQLTEARIKFSEIVNRALTQGPQRIMRRNSVVVLIAETEYEKLKRAAPSFKEFLLGDGPDFEGLDLSRDQSVDRDVSF